MSGANWTYRVLQDAFNEGTIRYWLRRAEAFEWAKPRLDDYHGRATRAELSARWRHCDERARACRARAEQARVDDEWPGLVLAVARLGGEPCQDAPIRRAS